ncbi:MAG: endonuclease/exonuclease/phosphatase family protein [Candidatus Saccharimonadales bacterium]
MKLTSLNLQAFINWKKREPHILRYLKNEAPDIIFFQEVVFLPEVSPNNQAVLLNRYLHYEHEQSVISRLQTSPIYKNYREGLAVLSKFPITTSETLVLNQDPLDHLQRIVQLFDIQYHGQIIKFANVHFSENPEMAYDHLDELLHILESRHEQRIIVGDFNMPDLKHVGLWQGKYLASTSQPYISKPENNMRIDYVLIPKADLILDVSLSDDTLSDHRALTLDIKLANKDHTPQARSYLN